MTYASWRAVAARLWNEILGTSDVVERERRSALYVDHALRRPKGTCDEPTHPPTMRQLRTKPAVRHRHRPAWDMGRSAGMSLHLRPITLTEARVFVAQHHRHNGPPVTWRFGVGVEQDGALVGVAMAGLPKARTLMTADPYLLEVNRTCTLGTKNANSMLYGAIARAAKALGYRRLITYTLESESGVSLRAAGWTVDVVTNPDPLRWQVANGQHQTLFGLNPIPDGPKRRWVKTLEPAA